MFFGGLAQWVVLLERKDILTFLTFLFVCVVTVLIVITVNAPLIGFSHFSDIQWMLLLDFDGYRLMLIKCSEY